MIISWLCVYDQANLNGVFGLTRARDAGFDMCHYNLHKSFSSPHGCQGPGAGAQCVSKELAGYVDDGHGNLVFPATMGQYNIGTQPHLKVNKEGYRFANESCPYDFLSYAASLQTVLPYQNLLEQDEPMS